MPKVLIVGSVALDSIKTPFGEHENILGGSAVHSSVAASFFSPVNLVGVVGNDFPAEHVQMLEKHDVDLAGLQVIKSGKTFHWKGYYEYDMNQAHSLDTQLNVFADFNPVLPENYKATPFVFLANIDPELQLRVLTQMKKPELVMLDTMNFWISSKREKLLEVMKKVDVVLLNDGEIRQLMDTPSIIKAARGLLDLGIKTLILKKGEHGVLLFHGRTIFAAPGFPLENVKDPTGAGDSFAGGFVGYLAKTGDISEKNMRQAIMVGQTMASYIVEDFSCHRFLHLKQRDIADRFDAFQKLCHFEKLEL
jgi:sugar/nucleoside kinase (ribokinase family)